VATLFDRVRIQNALVAEALTGPFYAVTYDATTKVATGDVNTPITPTAIANEVDASFEPAVLHRRGYRRERQTWTFELRLQFQREAVLEAFEDRMLLSPPILPRDPASGLPAQITLNLRGSRIQHPVQQEAPTGSFVIYTFEATRSPT